MVILKLPPRSRSRHSLVFRWWLCLDVVDIETGHPCHVMPDYNASLLRLSFLNIQFPKLNLNTKKASLLYFVPSHLSLDSLTPCSLFNHYCLSDIVLVWHVLSSLRSYTSFLTSTVFVKLYRVRHELLMCTEWLSSETKPLIAHKTFMPNTTGVPWRTYVF